MYLKLSSGAYGVDGNQTPRCAATPTDPVSNVRRHYGPVDASEAPTGRDWLFHAVFAFLAAIAGIWLIVDSAVSTSPMVDSPRTLALVGLGVFAGMLLRLLVLAWQLSKPTSGLDSNAL